MKTASFQSGVGSPGFAELELSDTVRAIHDAIYTEKPCCGIHDAYRSLLIAFDETLKVEARKLLPKKAKVTYPRFVETSELRRVMFYITRDGEAAAIVQLRALKRIYLAAALGTRKSRSGSKTVTGTTSGSRHHPYRHGYVEAAYSIRYLLKQM